jgi:acetyl-CoA carboxylase carboxyl transferase subunit alpha
MKLITLEFEKPIAEMERKLAELKTTSAQQRIDVTAEVQAMEQKIEETKRTIYSNLTAWQRVQLARHPNRPFTLDYVKLIFPDFLELHGDRRYSDDRAIVGGFARLDGQQVMLIGHQKGRDTKENLLRNFGCAHPEGYRKALRLMQLADKFGVPIVTLIDTPGAYPGVLILENAYYSVISPEGCAAILWKDRANSARAAEALKLTAKDLKELNLVDEVLPEPLGGAHRDPNFTAGKLREAILGHLAELSKLPTDKLLALRYDKYRAMGPFDQLRETPEAAAEPVVSRPAGGAETA